MSCCPKTDNDNSSDNDSEKYKTISYAVVSNDPCESINGEKLPLDIKRAVQTEMTKQEQLPYSEKISVYSKLVDILGKVTPGVMKGAQEENIDNSYAKSGKKATLVQIQKIKSRPGCRYLCQFDWLVFCQEVLQRVYEQDGAEYHHLILPIEFRTQVMELLCNEQGHQVVEHTLQLA